MQLPDPVAVKPYLLFAYGNPERGDDALGPLLLSRLQQRCQVISQLITQIDFLTDFQLQVEHALDLHHRRRVILLDASLNAPAPFHLRRVRPAADLSYTTHTMSPESLLYVYERVCSESAPPCRILALRAYRMALGETLSPQAQAHLPQAEAFLWRLLNRYTGNALK